MERPRGNEMRAFLIAASLLVALLIIVIVVLTTFNSVKTIDQEQEKAKQREVENLREQAVRSTESLEDVANDPRMIRFMNPEMLKNRSGEFDITPFLDSTIFIMRAVGSGEYAAIVSDGRVVVHAESDGVDFDDIEVPLSMPGEGYTVLKELGGRQGYFVEFFQEVNYPGIGAEQFSVSAVDLTGEMQAQDEYYDSERSSLIWRQVWIGLIGLAVALAVCLVGLRLLTRYYITRPIEDLTDISHRLMNGTFEGEIRVDEQSDFADLQRLLQSGKLMLDRLEEETG